MKSYLFSFANKLLQEVNNRRPLTLPSISAFA
jgi:hypothetical protein